MVGVLTRQGCRPQGDKKHEKNIEKEQPSVAQGNGGIIS